MYMVICVGNLNGGIDDIIQAPFFSTVNWSELNSLSMPAPYIPPIKSSDDTSNFDNYDEENDVPAYTGSQEFFKDF